MVEKYLGKEVAEDIYYSSMLSRMILEKMAENKSSSIEKSAKFNLIKFLRGAGGHVLGFGKDVWDTVSKTPSGLAWLGALGAGTGYLGAKAYDVIKDQVTYEDPEEKFNSDMEALYNSRKMEREDSKWMDRVRALRDELKRGYNKMSTEEYRKKYDELVSALDERKA